MRFLTVSALGLVSACSYTGYQAEYDALRDAARRQPAYTPGPEGSSAELESKLLALFDREPAPDLSGTPSVDDVVRVALFRNPDLRADVKRFEALIEAVPQAASAPAPEIGLEAMTGLDSAFEAVSKITVQLMQTLLFPGKLEASSRMALEMAAEGGQELQERALELRLDVARMCGDLYALDRAIRILAENRKTLDQLAQAAKARYEAGQVTEQDVLRARVRTLELERRELEMARRRREVEAELNRLLGLREPAPVGAVTFDPAAAEPGPIGPILARALEKRPEVAAMTHRLRQALAGVRLAELDWWPDATPMAMGEIRPRDMDELSLGLSMHLAFLRPTARAAAERQARAVLGETARRFEARLSEIAREVTVAHARAAESAQNLALLRDKLVPESRRAYEAAMAGYRAGRVDFETALDAWLTAQETEIELHMLTGRHFESREALRRAEGVQP
jgi:outer membrane protein TolC